MSEVQLIKAMFPTLTTIVRYSTGGGYINVGGLKYEFNNNEKLIYVK